MGGGSARIDFGWVGLKDAAEVDNEQCQIVAFVSGPDGDYPGHRTDDCSGYFLYDEVLEKAGSYTVVVRDELTNVEGKASFRIIAGSD